MEQIPIRDGEEFIRLGQALKKAGLVGAGSDAKMLIQNGEVKVNNVTEERRGRKLYPNDIVTFDTNSFQVVK